MRVLLARAKLIFYLSYILLSASHLLSAMESFSGRWLDGGWWFTSSSDDDDALSLL